LSFAGPGSTSVTISRSGTRLAYSYVNADSDILELDRGVISRSGLSSTRSEENPQFSPDGNKVAFSSTRSGNSEIWIANRDCSNSFQLTNSRDSGSPRWSPDGKLIVFDTQTPDGLRDIYVIGASGGQPTPIVRDAADDKVPSFSRDGRSVYFTSTRAGRAEIY